MGRALLALLLAAAAGRTEFELEGRLTPPTHASVSLHGAVSPFNASTLADSRGHFRFRKLPAGTYTVIVFVPSQGELRETIEVGPGTADRKGKIAISLALNESRLVKDRRAGTVSTRQLKIPDRARREYAEAMKLLGRRDIEGAEDRLERAVEIAPQFAEAWNHLGTMAYQTRRFALAEERFRKALEIDASMYEPLVNLGGTLLSEYKLDEALQYNIHAVLMRPSDALANSQLGMTYFAVGKLDLAEKYLIEAKRLDPAHFSHPQMTLAEIYMRRKQPERAAAELEDFVTRHPDYPAAAKIKEAVQKLRSR
ncbi:MAG: tetratricopeptide repeat protein [Bryobacteraceae bacterium]